MSSVKDALKAKMDALKARREQSRKDNHEAVVEEDRKAKLPKNFDAKKRKAEWEEADAEARKEAEARGEDYQRVKAREVTAMDADRAHKKKMSKKNADTGFADFTQTAHRHYSRLTKQLKPDLAEYEKSKREWGDDSADADTLAYGQHDKVSASGLDRMVADLEKQVEKRGKFSRRRAHYHDSDIDFINERNRNFNKKLERFYGKHTQEIKDNLERGTAV